jgi:hypothetical protein
MTDKEMLTTLLSIEGFFFTAITVSVAVVRGRLLGEERSWRGFIVALLAVAVLTCIAIAAVSAWRELFTGDSRWPDAAGRQLQRLILLAAILTQPVFACLIALQARPKPKWARRRKRWHAES